tara:strand:- start:1226 stop:1570 length:345 start_codon:yes stop_codon:yes gene_type:complete
MAKTAAWQRKEGQSESGGLNKKGIASYRAANPGSKLKMAVTTKPSKLKKGGKRAKRRKSYCSRSDGQRKMHNIDCSKTPKKRICKARRKWNCKDGGMVGSSVKTYASGGYVEGK